MADFNEKSLEEALLAIRNDMLSRKQLLLVKPKYLFMFRYWFESDEDWNKRCDAAKAVVAKFEQESNRADNGSVSEA